jgi:hypothetical protein
VAENPSPPFRDSDALYIIARRMERLADAMTSHDYSTVLPDLAEIRDWMDWLAAGIESREEALDA